MRRGLNLDWIDHHRDDDDDDGDDDGDGKNDL